MPPEAATRLEIARRAEIQTGTTMKLVAGF